MKRVLVYSHDTYGLGNIRRMLAICEHLCTVHADLSILIVSGSPMLHAFRLSPRIDYVKLPCLTRTAEGDYEVKSLGIGYEATIAMRRQLLLSAVRGFEPDLILVDKKPFGVDEELRPAFEDTAGWDRPPSLVLLLRDILDDPAETIRVWSKNNYYNAIEERFDAVLVLGSMEVFDLADRYRFPSGAAAKVEYCGYLGREVDPGRRVDGRSGLDLDADEPLVLVTPGGGQDGARLTDCFADAIRGGARAGTGFHSLIVAGPELPLEAKARLEDLSRGRGDVTLIDFTDDMMSYMAASDLVISMGGYNTVCEVLSARRPSIVVPRVSPVQEQLIRARLLADRGLLTMIHPDEMSPARLLQQLKSTLAAGFTPRAELDLRGLERVEKHLAGLIGDDG